jgi:hypothetical protein
MKVNTFEILEACAETTTHNKLNFHTINSFHIHNIPSASGLNAAPLMIKQVCEDLSQRLN